MLKNYFLLLLLLANFNIFNAGSVTSCHPRLTTNICIGVMGAATGVGGGLGYKMGDKYTKRLHPVPRKTIKFITSLVGASVGLTIGLMASVYTCLALGLIIKEESN